MPLHALLFWRGTSGSPGRQDLPLSRTVIDRQRVVLRGPFGLRLASANRAGPLAGVGPAQPRTRAGAMAQTLSASRPNVSLDTGQRITLRDHQPADPAQGQSLWPLDIPIYKRFSHRLSSRKSLIETGRCGPAVRPATHSPFTLRHEKDFALSGVSRRSWRRAGPPHRPHAALWPPRRASRRR